MNALDIILLCIGIILVLIIIGFVICLSIVMSWNESANNLMNPKNQAPQNDTNNGNLEIN